jgi:iron complex outermembrane receptor protein
MKLNRLAIALSGVGLLTLAQQGFAQEAVKKEEDKKQEVQKVIVTGSSIKRVNYETASPVQVITREEMTRGGATSLTEVCAMCRPIWVVLMKTALAALPQVHRV